MSPNDTTCQQRLIEGGFVPPCPVSGCEVQRESPTWHEYCAGQPPYAPAQGIGCYNALSSEWRFAPVDKVFGICTALHDQDPAWKLAYCYCCCSAFSGVAIAAPGGSQVAGSLVPGTTVLAGSLVGPHRALAWRPATIAVSMGVQPGWTTMIQIVHGETGTLVVTPDHVFLLADRTLTTAAKLVPGDRLVDGDGNPVTVRIVSHGEHNGGAHHLATSDSCHGDTGDHLLVAGGVVVGDYALQLGFAALPAALKAADHEARPAVGTPAYRTQHAQLARDANIERYALRHDDLGHPSGAFIITTRGSRVIPAYARRFITPEQAADIAEGSRLADPRDAVTRAVFAQIVDDLHALYPKVSIVADWTTDDVNAFVSRSHGRDYLVAGGGLARRPALSVNGLTMVLAQGLGHLYGRAPYDDDHYSCTGTSDLFGFGVISRKLWPGADWLDNCMQALADVEAMFALIHADHAGGDPLDHCRYPSIACRIETMKTAIAGGALPACAEPCAKP